MIMAREAESLERWEDKTEFRQAGVGSGQQERVHEPVPQILRAPCPKTLKREVEVDLSSSV